MGLRRAARLGRRSPEPAVARPYGPDKSGRYIIINHPFYTIMAFEQQPVNKLKQP